MAVEAAQTELSHQITQYEEGSSNLSAREVTREDSLSSFSLVSQKSRLRFERQIHESCISAPLTKQGSDYFLFSTMLSRMFVKRKDLEDGDIVSSKGKGRIVYSRKIEIVSLSGAMGRNSHKCKICVP